MDLITQITWRDCLAIASFIFGIVTLIAYLDQRRSGQRTTILAKWAELNLDKSISEEQIRNLLVQKALMEEEITRTIPALARTAVLEEQAKLHEKALCEHFAAWRVITLELESKKLQSGLDPQLQEAIVDRIFPMHMRHERRDRFRTRVTVLTVGLAASATVLPHPINSVCAIAMVLPLSYAGARLYALNEDPARAFRVLQPWCHLLYVLAVIAALGIGIFFMFRQQANPHVGIGLIAIAICLTAIYFWARKGIDRFVKKLCSSQSLLTSN